MQIVHEIIEGIHYIDVILTSEDLNKLSLHEMLEGRSYQKYCQYYIGLRTIGEVKHQFEDWELQNLQPDE